MTKPTAAVKPRRKPATQAIPRLNRNALILLGLWIVVAIISNSGVSLLGEETWKQWVAHILLGIAQVLTQFLTGGSAGSIGTTGTSGISRTAVRSTGPLVSPPGLIDEGTSEVDAVDAAETEPE